jgi:hypothetical protein
MKRFAILLVLFSLPAYAATPWEQYLDRPSSHNALRVSVIGYSRPIDGGYDAADLEILKLQVIAGDAQAFRLAYRLSEKSDGALAEELGSIFAAAVRPNSAFFLRQVKALKHPCSRFDLDVAGLEYVDRPRASAYELAMRAAALRSVKAPELQTTRLDCLSVLEHADK